MAQEIGTTFEALGSLLANLPEERVGACLDTAHAFGAGYDLRGVEGVHQILTAFEEHVGIARLGAMHLNDSKETWFAPRPPQPHWIGQTWGGDFLGVNPQSALAPRPSRPARDPSC